MKITAIKQQAKRRDRYSIFVDGAYAFSISEAGLLSLQLVSGQELTPAKLAALKQASGTDKAYGNALRYVAMRPRSVWEMESYLQRKEVDEPVAAQIIERLKQSGLLDDMSFARAWVANRRLLKSTSQRRLRQELAQKRVPETIMIAVMQEDEQTDERTVLRELVAKKQARYPDKTKFMQYLARQGFSYEDITFVLENRAD